MKKKCAQSGVRAAALAAWLALASGLFVTPMALGAPDAAAERQRAMTLERQGDNGEAEAAWRSILKTQPNDAEAYAHLGLLEARQERYREAVPLYRKAIALHAALPGLRLNLGLAQFKAGELKDAIATFEPLLKADPGDQRLTILLGMAHYGLGEYAAATPYLRAATGRDAQNLPMRLALAHSCLWAGQYQCVLDAYREILTLNAESAEADMLAGEALDEMKDSAGAEKQFRAAVQANPKEANVHFGLAYLLMEQHRFDEAVAEYQAELANDPQNALALTYLGDTLVKMGRFAEAREVLEKAAAEPRPAALVSLDLGIVAIETGDSPEAIRELNRAIALEPGNVTAHFRLATLYRSMGKRDEARAEFAKASSLNQKTDEGVFRRIAEASARPEGKDAPEAPAAPGAAKPDRP